MAKGTRQLVEVIAALRADIEAAIDEGEGKPIKFDLNEVEVELKTAITGSGSAEAGGEVNFSILGFDIGSGKAAVKGDMAMEDGHTIKLKLKPKRLKPKGDKADPNDAVGEAEYIDVEMSDLA